MGTLLHGHALLIFKIHLELKKIYISFKIYIKKRGGVALSVRLSTLIHEVVGLNLARVILSVLPKLGGWMTGPAA